MNWFGAAYYPEHWPRERWKKDVRTMGEIGINVVRIGEFSWSVVERKRGEIDFSVLDGAVDLLDSEGIKVIMGTPTCTPPPWLTKEFPEILQKDVNGLVIASGSRRHYCFNSKIYREETSRIVEAFADHFGNDPRIVAWQIDNEFGCHNSTVCFCEDCAVAFRVWLKKKYGSIDKLNKAWGTVFWSQIFNDWEEIEPPRRTLTSPNPSLVLDYKRFSSDSAIDYHNLQREIIMRKSEAPITHNLMVNFTEIDYKKLSDSIDFVSWDNYIVGDYDPDLQALNHDLMRSLKKQPFLVMEQQPGRVNWRTVNPSYESSQLSFWVKQSFAHGAFGSLIFRFRQLPFGSEQFHTGLIDYDGEPTERAQAFSKAIEELKDWSVVFPQREAAIYIDYENFWINDTDNLNNKFDLLIDGILPVYKSVRSLGYNVDFVFPGDSLEGYLLAFVPSSFKLERCFVEELRRFKGDIFFTALTDQKDGRNFIKKTEESFITELMGLRVVDAGGIETKVEISFTDHVFNGSFVVEKILPSEDCEVLAVYLNGPFTNHPALVKRANMYYLSTVPEIGSFQTLLIEAGIERKASGPGRVIKDESNTILQNPFPHSITMEVGGKDYTLNEYEVRRLQTGLSKNNG